MANARFCEQCGNALSATARFCPNCGFSISGDAPASVPGSAPATRPASGGIAGSLPWLLPTVALVGVLGYTIATRPGSAPSGTDAPPSGFMPQAPDISTLSPDERVDRLFNRVMTLSAAGKQDSVAFFAPMAANSFGALAPLSLHRHYDLGLILLVSGELAGARAQADSILAVAPRHLLGLALAMRTATSAGNAAEARRFGTKLKDALASEQARGLQEYQDHAADITAAVAQAEGRAPASPPR